MRRKKTEKKIERTKYASVWKSSPRAEAYCTQPRLNRPNSQGCRRTSMLMPRTRHFPNGT